MGRTLLDLVSLEVARSCSKQAAKLRALATGVAPNFGCCTANFNQGWPKFTNNIVLMSTADDGIVIATIAPVLATLPSGATVEIVTDYPFADTISVHISGLKKPTPVHIRIPGWATKATVPPSAFVSASLIQLMATPYWQVNGAPAANGTLHKFSAPVQSTTIKIIFAPEIRVETV